MKIGAFLRKVNVKPHYCRINFENASSEGLKGSKIQFLLVVEKENKFASTFDLLHIINFKKQGGKF